MIALAAIPHVGIFPHRLRGLIPMPPPVPVLSVVSMGRAEINITPRERGGRVVLGGATAIAGIVLLASGASALAVVPLALLVLAGLDLVVTGALGHCPLILDRRLASGELNVEQYKQLRDTIRDPAPAEGGTGPPRASSAPG
jgi:hypothetical protein